jgi:hypothetical protein
MYISFFLKILKLVLQKSYNHKNSITIKINRKQKEGDPNQTLLQLANAKNKLQLGNAYQFLKVQIIL